MSNTVIKVEDLSKLYRLGEIGTGTISHDLNRWWARLRGKEDPYAKLGQANDRTTKGNSDFVWSLKDLNFEVKQGEVLGIIGRNGAGKSTLLKVLSKVTAPTSGRIKVRGRIASLLEVGTGFHPELTGRENVFLNGAILGMSKSEIRSKFDEIVDFSGVERYIDTPVKRYSSGMYVRLAFAVAAFLEPEILIVDEVLAVGDIEFQKKCLGRMKDVSVNDGRTVLFVSHNMAAVKSLCNKGIVMKNGLISLEGSVEEAITDYYSVLSSSMDDKALQKANTSEIEVYEVTVVNYFSQPGAIRFDTPLIIRLKGKSLKLLKGITFNLNITTFEHVSLFTVRSRDEYEAIELNGEFEVNVVIQHSLRAGSYILAVGIDSYSQNVYFNDSVTQVDVLEVGDAEYKYKNYGLVDAKSAWQIKG